MTSFFRRYQQGDESNVWAELRALGQQAREPQYEEDVRAVCDEMALRALHNVEKLVDRLSADGFIFRDATDHVEQSPLLRPSEDVDSLIDWLNETAGTLPLAVESWMRTVGDVNLVGAHPQWPDAEQADPLVIEIELLRFGGDEARSYFAEELEMWRDGGDPRELPPFLLSVAPDSLHKANISGGGPYGFELPDPTVEGSFVNEDARTELINEPFTGYLNRVFRSGGFPGQRVAAPDGFRERYSAGLVEL